MHTFLLPFNSTEFILSILILFYLFEKQIILMMEYFLIIIQNIILI